MMKQQVLRLDRRSQAADAGTAPRALISLGQGQAEAVLDGWMHLVDCASGNTALGEDVQ